MDQRCLFIKERIVTLQDELDLVSTLGGAYEIISKGRVSGNTLN